MNPPHPTILPLVKQMTHALHTLERFLQLCGRLGLDARKGRYVTYRAVQQERMEAFTRDYVAAFRDMRGKRLGADWFWSLLELETMVRILPYLETRPDAEIRPKLEKVLKGPAYLDGERAEGSTNEARNYLAELVAATQFWRVGLTPELGESPDIRLGDVPGGPVFLQCKRMFSTSHDALARRIEEAATQLSKNDLPQNRQAAGLIFVSIERSVWSGGIFDSGREGEKVLARSSVVLKRIAEAYSRWQDLDDHRILGVAFHTRAAGFVQLPLLGPPEQPSFLAVEDMLCVRTKPPVDHLDLRWALIQQRLENRPRPPLLAFEDCGECVRLGPENSSGCVEVRPGGAT